MKESLKILNLLLYKAFLVRKRFWKATLWKMIAVLIFLALVQYTRFIKLPDSLKRNNTREITIYPAKSHTHIMNPGIERVVFRKIMGYAVENDMYIDMLKEANTRDQTQKAVLIIDSTRANHLDYKYLSDNPIQNFFETEEKDDNMYEDLKFTSGYLGLVILSSLTSVQMCLEGSYTRSRISPEFPPVFSIQQMPEWPRAPEKGSFLDPIFRLFISCSIIFIFSIPLTTEAIYPADEKIIGVHVLMSMHGVPNYLNLVSWLLSGMAQNGVLVILVTILFNISYSPGEINSLLHYGNSFIYCVMLILNFGHCIAYGIHVTSYFSNSLFMSTGWSIVYLASAGMHFVLAKSLSSSWSLPYLGILFPNILLFLLCQEFNKYENYLTGVRFANIFTPSQPENGFAGCVGVIFFFSILGTFLHILMADYINEIRPGKYGVKKHPLFFLDKFLKNKKKFESNEEILDSRDTKLFEPVATGALTPGIQITNVTKTFFSGLIHKKEVKAIRGISIEFYKGQITALLGKNGAGKTTLMSILTGMTSATTGSVVINGKNLKTELKEVIREISLCPQQDMLFPNLSVHEQILFFSKLKNNRNSFDETKKLINKLNMTDKRHALPKELSGGQKRRTCLAMALVGDSNVVILDEPTSGMDPKSRRDVWDLILKLRGDKTILISTHDMEEADILGDRIAIINFGLVKSYGTPMFLKKILGKGDMEVALSMKKGADPNKIRDLFDTETKILSNDGNKLILNVPNSSSFPDTLDNLESKKSEFGISGINVSTITLEQVFLNITQDEKKVIFNLKNSNALRSYERKPSHMQRILALLSKNFTFAIRSPWKLIFAILVPVIGLSLIALTYSIIQKNRETQEVSLTLKSYENSLIYYSSDTEMFANTLKAVVKNFGGEAKEISGNMTNAILDLAKNDKPTYYTRLIAAIVYTGKTSPKKLNIIYSRNAYYSIPVALNLAANTLIATKGNQSYKIDAKLGQIPHLLEPEYDNIDVYRLALNFVALFYPFTSVFIYHSLEENRSNIKLLQLMTGISWFAYWAFMYLADLIKFFVVSISILIAAISLDWLVDFRLLQAPESAIYSLLFFCFALSVLPFMYLLTFTSKPNSTIFKILTSGPLIFVIIETIFTYFEYIKFLNWLRPIEKYMFKIIPYVSFFKGQVLLLENSLKIARCRRLPNFLYNLTCFKSDPCCDFKCFDGICANPPNYFTDTKNDSLAESITFLLLSAVVGFLLIGLLEEKIWSYFKKRLSNHVFLSNEETFDEQVRIEKQLIQKQISQTSEITNPVSKMSQEEVELYQFFVYELHKMYKGFVAVDDVNFGVKKSECFGLLGTNGAGKTTTFRMIVGEVVPDHGWIHIKEKDFKNHKKYCLSKIGYCPQMDAIIESLNSYEHLRLFARLRGVPDKYVEGEIFKWINKLNINTCAPQPSGTYSGGNKRRLNIAMALIGDPDLILLDEPTTGVDPAARRSLWNTIQACQSQGQTVLLTSHSMEECEALCNRLAIMVGGELVCIGASQELKQKFGVGHNIQMKLDPVKSEVQIEEIKIELAKSLNGSIVDENSSFLAYHVKSENIKWKFMYDVVENLLKIFDCIEDYSIQSSTLEQLFMQFAREAKP